MQSTQRFSDRAVMYARYRPTYPSAIINAIVEGFVDPTVADLGAGTGIASRLLADAGAIVYAIEPNVAMRAAIAPHLGITAVAATAEQTTLPDASIDIVMAFQAYHWFDAEAVLDEVARIARPHARFAAVWNRRDRRDPFTGDYESIIDRYDESGGVDRVHREATVVDDLRRHGWHNVRSVRSEHRHELDWESLIGFIRSCSYLPERGAAFDALESDLRDVCRRFEPGGLAFSWVSEAYLAER